MREWVHAATIAYCKLYTSAYSVYINIQSICLDFRSVTDHLLDVVICFNVTCLILEAACASLEVRLDMFGNCSTLFAFLGGSGY